MFWSGNFMAVRELNFLLKEENVTLTSVLEADDILQECKADNKALIQFLTRPDILAELITLITEEPPKHVELSQQYRHASIACEVLTSHLSTLSDRLTLDTAQMNRLCDFINKDPPLNPLLASYFSKTVEMLLERSPKQDWYLYHIVCLRVLDFFKSRRDFLPNLLRHISTSAIADTFKYLIRLEDLFNKPIMEWLEEHQFIDSLIQIICGTYVPEHFPPSEEPEKGQREASEKELSQDTGESSKDDGSQESAQNSTESPPSNRPVPEELTAEEKQIRAERVTAVAAANAASLLCDLVATGCAGEGCHTRSRTAWQLCAALGTCAAVRGVLGCVFTCRAPHRAMALHHAARLLHALLLHRTSENEEERCSVELAVALHLPLLHQALLHDPSHYAQEEDGVRSAGGDGAGAGSAGGGRRVGSARVSTAALIAQLALSEVEEVATTLLTLGTPGVLIELMFSFPENNFLHAQVLAFCRHALSNRLYRTQYASHLFVECDLLNRLMDAFEENEHKLNNSPRAGYMGHVIQLLGCISSSLEQLEEVALPQRWPEFRDQRLAPVLLQHDTPLGGTYPSDNIYEAGDEEFSDMAVSSLADLGDEVLALHNVVILKMRNEQEQADSAEFIADGLGLDDSGDKRVTAQNSFLELASQRFDDDMWDDAPEGDDFGTAPLPGHSSDSAQVWAVPAWESGGAEGCAEGCAEAGAGAGVGGEGWAQFDAFAAPPDAFAEPAPAEPFAAYWPSEHHAADACEAEGLEAGLRGLRLEAGGGSAAGLACNLLTAMSGMSPDALANLVNANLQPLPLPLHPHPHPHPVNLSDASEVSTPNPVTPPAEFSNPPHILPSDTSDTLADNPPADANPPSEFNTPTEISSTDLLNETDSKQDKPTAVNCVSSDSPVESTASETSDPDKTIVNDLSHDDKVTKTRCTASPAARSPPTSPAAPPPPAPPAPLCDAGDCSER